MFCSIVLGAQVEMMHPRESVLDGLGSDYTTIGTSKPRMSLALEGVKAAPKCGRGKLCFATTLKRSFNILIETFSQYQNIGMNCYPDLATIELIFFFPPF